MSDVAIMNISINAFSCIICIILLLCAVTIENKEDKLNRIFISVISCYIPLLIVDIIIFLYEGKTGVCYNEIFKAAYFLSFVLGSVLLMLFTFYILVFIKIKTISKKLAVYSSYVAVAACGINTVLVIITQFNGMYYFIDKNNVFFYGDCYLLSQFFAVACILINTGVIISHFRSFEMREKVFLLSYAVLPIIAIIAQNIVKEKIASIDFATTLTIIIFHAGIQSEQAKQLKKNELELSESRIDIMLSQIQPHFLYNTLNTIENFCYKDGQLAAELVSCFSNYLRDNMDSLKQKELVPFSRELEHMQIYLKIEKSRFSERLNIIFNLEYTDFSLPILTVQPLVENAVRHGVTKRITGGTVTISTRCTPEWIEITVADNGVGFDVMTKNTDGRNHVGIENVRNRLAAQCGGTLQIESVKGVGTTATINIPRKGQSVK